MNRVNTSLSCQLLTWTFAALSSVGCAASGGDSTGDSDARAGAVDEAPPTGEGDTAEAFNGCAPEDYVDSSDPSADRVIAIAASGLTYTPKCMIIAPGQSVRWEGSLSAHPLAPGNPEDARAGSPDNPIQGTDTGRSVTFSFPAAGTFPYHCTLHAFGTGQGMAGAIQVR